MIEIKKDRFYYYTENESAYALSALTGIPIKISGRCSFNQEFVDEVLHILNVYNVAYCIDGCNYTTNKSINNFNSFVILGKIIYNIQRHIKEENKRIRKKLKTINQI